MGSGMRVDDDLGPALAWMVLHAAVNVAEAMSEGKERVESYGKSNAPWTDRTGTARASLNARVFLEGGEVVLEFAHGVDYGYWLELIQEGQYAIIMPTLEAVGPEIMRDAGAKAVTYGGGAF